MNNGFNIAKEEYPFTPSYLKVKNGYMHFVDKGPEKEQSKGTFLMIHGNPSWSYLYRRVIREFSSEYRCIAPDHIGCGMSDKPQWHTGTLEEHVRNLESLILTLDLKNITLMVHDWGGAIGFGAALRHPKRFKRFIVANTSAFWMPYIPFRINICRMPLIGEIALQGLNLFARAATFMAVNKSMPEKIKKGFLAPYNNWNNRKATLDFVRDIPLNKDHPSLGLLLDISRKIKIFKEKPMRIFWGMKDFCFNEKFLLEWEKRFPLAEVTRFDDAGHYVFEDCPETILDEIDNFLVSTDNQK